MSDTNDDCTHDVLLRQHDSKKRYRCIYCKDIVVITIEPFGVDVAHGPQPPQEGA